MRELKGKLEELGQKKTLPRIKKGFYQMKRTFNKRRLIQSQLKGK